MNKLIEFLLREPFLAVVLAGAILQVLGKAVAALGKRGQANYGAYAASKFAVIGFTQSLAYELAPIGIRTRCRPASPGRSPGRAGPKVSARAASPGRR